MRAALRLAAAGAASGAVGVGAYARYDEGTARSVTFWYHAFPVWAQYRAVQWRVASFRCLLSSLGAAPVASPQMCHSAL